MMYYWQLLASNLGHRLRDKMTPGKVYLYQLYTETFVEFDSVQDAEKFRAYLDNKDPMWDYDPVATLNTNDPKIQERWKELIVHE